jgi:hypothetical protein
MDFNAFMAAVGGAGFATATAVFMIFQGAAREKRMSDTLEAMRVYQQTEAAEQAKATTAALSQNTMALQQNNAALSAATNAMSTFRMNKTGA